MRQWVKAHPWIWIVFFFLGVLGANLAMVVISILFRPVVLPH